MNIKLLVSLEKRKEKFKVLETNILQRKAEFGGHSFIVPRELSPAVMKPQKGLDSSIYSAEFTEHLLRARHW